MNVLNVISILIERTGSKVIVLLNFKSVNHRSVVKARKHAFVNDYSSNDTYFEKVCVLLHFERRSDVTVTVKFCPNTKSDG